MIRLRGVPITDEEAVELARRLRQHAGSAVVIAEHVERALTIGTGLIGTNPTEARGVLAVVNAWVAEEPTSERLLEARASLAEMLAARDTAASDPLVSDVALA